MAQYKKTFFVFIILALIASPLMAAEPGAVITGKAINTAFPFTKLGGATAAATSIVVWFYAIFWIVAVGFIIWSAFTFLTASGEEEKITLAKKRLQYALIAAVVALLSMGVDLIVKSLLAGA